MKLVAFFRRELAPTPGRFRATMRILVGCLVGTVLSLWIGDLISPHGHWVITTVFTLSVADVGASIRKALQRAAGTLAGGCAGLLLVVALADFPVFFLPMLGILVAVGLFLSLTTSAPYVFQLGTLTAVLVAFFPVETPSTAVETGLGRMFAIAIGVVCGTGAQLVLWPEDPEQRLCRALAGRLAAVGAAMERLAAAASGGARAALPPPALGGDDLSGQLDFLASAEARHPSLRERHAEQLSIIVEVDRLFTAAVWMAGAQDRLTAGLGEEVGRELAAVGRECAVLAASLAAQRPPAEPAPAELARPGAVSAAPGLRPNLDDIRVALERIRAALRFLDPERVIAPHLDRPASAPVFTDAVSPSNTPALQLALKAALALEICYVLMQALHWGDLQTAAITVVLVTQTSVGATVQKSILRVAGAALGGFLGIAAIVTMMPNLETVGGLLVVASIGFTVAGWILAGSARISYMGLQTGMAFAMCVTDATGPTVTLTTGRDRVIGIVIGLLVMLFVTGALWPARARLQMRPALARTLRSIGGLARVAPRAREYGVQLAVAVRRRTSIYSGLAAVMRLSNEASVEPDADTPDAIAEREWIARLVADAQAVFLALLALIRHRLSPAFPALPPGVSEEMTAFDREVGDALDALAARMDGGAPRPMPDLAGRFAALDAAVGAAPAPAGGREPAAMVTAAEVDHVAIARDVLDQMARLAAAVERPVAR